MKQILQNIQCKNPQFRNCATVDSICINCKRCFLEEGHHAVVICHHCGTKTKCMVETVYNNGTYWATCTKCSDAMEKNSSLYNDWVWFYESDNPKSKEEFNKLTERILDLPRNELRLVLKSLHSGFER